MAPIDYPYTVLPLVGFEFARFGEPRSRHRATLGAFESFQRDPDSPVLTDLYLDSLMSLDYDEHDRLEFIEILSNAAAVVHVDGVQFANRPFEEVIGLMTERGHRVVGPYGGTYAIPALGIRFGPTWDDETDREVTDGISLVPKETIPRLRA